MNCSAFDGFVQNPPLPCFHKGGNAEEERGVEDGAGEEDKRCEEDSQNKCTVDEGTSSHGNL